MKHYIPTLTGSEPTKTLTSISAVFTQGSNVITTSTPLDSLKSFLVVTGNYSDSSTATITNYTLSGTLTEGTSTITVTYNSLTTTFDVTVTKASSGGGSSETTKTGLVTEDLGSPTETVQYDKDTLSSTYRTTNIYRINLSTNAFSQSTAYGFGSFDFDVTGLGYNTIKCKFMTYRQNTTNNLPYIIMLNEEGDVVYQHSSEVNLTKDSPKEEFEYYIPNTVTRILCCSPNKEFTNADTYYISFNKYASI